VNSRWAFLISLGYILSSFTWLNTATAQDLSDVPPPIEAPAAKGGEAPVAPSSSGGKVTAVKDGKKQKLQLGFDDELVRGKLNNPEVDYLFARKQFNFKKLIKLREDFIPEAQKGRVEFGAGD
jgi:hypothetical protein